MRKLHYSTLALDLTESEAKDIFDHLCDRGLCHIDIFEEAWNESGHPQTLLEYVYFLTHGVPLRARISEQIGRLDHVNASFLQYISVSNVLPGKYLCECHSELVSSFSNGPVSKYRPNER